ncbi:hypothetical protein RRG08_017675 [Elysia crispata]|uniref:Uncharacterized protein n=1 Tax=Elysia crispata TaxID=231223 RepID=A0AAE0ZB63_9GAST|nr:hypothetical protein RRG08_017675 [Elysia crispata]
MKSSPELFGIKLKGISLRAVRAFLHSRFAHRETQGSKVTADRGRSVRKTIRKRPSLTNNPTVIILHSVSADNSTFLPLTCEKTPFCACAWSTGIIVNQPMRARRLIATSILKRPVSHISSSPSGPDVRAERDWATLCTSSVDLSRAGQASTSQGETIARQEAGRWRGGEILLYSRSDKTRLCSTGRLADTPGFTTCQVQGSPLSNMSDDLTDKQTGRQTNRQGGRQTDRKTKKTKKRQQATVTSARACCLAVGVRAYRKSPMVQTQGECPRQEDTGDDKNIQFCLSVISSYDTRHFL